MRPDFSAPDDLMENAASEIAAAAEWRKERRFMGIAECGTCAAMCNARLATVRVATVADDRCPAAPVLHIGKPRALPARRVVSRISIIDGTFPLIIDGIGQ